MISFPRPEYPLSAAALLIWPLLCMALFIWFPRHRAAILCFLLAVLYLPSATGVVIVGMPALTRKTMAGLGIVIAAFVLNRKPWAEGRSDRVAKGALALILLSDVLRVVANRDAIVYPNRLIPPLEYHAIVTFMIEDALLLGVPFFLGLAIGGSLERCKELIEVWLKVGLVYMILALIEVRFSPQVHRWVYGYFQHTFLQMMRGDGFRPLVFMEHGLELALFTAACLLLALLAGRLGYRIWGVRASILALVFLVVLVLTKSYAAIFYGAIGLLLLFWAPVRVRASVAKWIAIIVLSLPLTRLLGWVPTGDLVAFVEDLDADRARSLWFRFWNEDSILDKVIQRPWTGWGGFDRIHAYDQWGTKTSTIDGSWVLEFASGGVPRFLGIFGLLTWPILKAQSVARKLPDGPPRQFLSGLCVVTALVVLDLVPNSFFNYLAPLLAGTLLGASQSPGQVGAVPSSALVRVGPSA